MDDNFTARSIANDPTDESQLNPPRTAVRGFPELDDDEGLPLGSRPAGHGGGEAAFIPQFEGKLEAVDSPVTETWSSDNGIDELGLLAQEIYVPRTALGWPDGPRPSSILLSEIDGDYTCEHEDEGEEEIPCLLFKE